MPTDTHVHIWIALLSFLGGGGSVKYLVYVAKSMPPLPKDAGWWLTFFYSLVKGLSGLDPSSAIISQHTLAAIETQTGMTVPTESGKA